MTDENSKKNPKPRRVGQVLARGKNKWLIRIFLGRDSEGKRHYHSETFHGLKKHAEQHARLLRETRECA